ncbi:MAG: hypothetical protein N2Z79_01845, partial [Candidatus Omnitrophica bacterium]|nr:hypothetical protein [Candidatus Omnitrophota bacterium]
MLKKSLILILLVLFGLINFYPKSYASEIKDILDEFLLVDLELSSIMIEMYKYIGWFWDEKRWLKDASQEAIKELKMLQAKVAKLEVPQELVSFKDKTHQLILNLNNLYLKIEKKSKDSFRKEYENFNQFYSQYLEELKSLRQKYQLEPASFNDFGSSEEELKLIENSQDRQTYLKAIQLIKEKKFSSAYEILVSLKEKYKGSLFEDCLNLRISDCYLHPKTDLIKPEEFEKYEEILNFLEKILDKDRYLPILYETFYKWRTNSQSLFGGMSNMSEIPNKYYNQKRYKAI